MKELHTNKIAEELNVSPWQVIATARLFEEGATVPFISRYRKEVTGALDEVAVTAIRDRIAQLGELDARKETILSSLEKQGVLSDELRSKINETDAMSVLEDIYLPFRPKKKTRASVAREKGLEPLALLLFEQDAATDPADTATAFISEDKGVSSADEALAGAKDIIAEWVNENQDARSKMRDFFMQHGEYVSSVIKGKEEEGSKFKDYFDWREKVKDSPSHRILAMRRGEKEGALSLTVVPSEEDAISILSAMFVKGSSKSSILVEEAVRDSYKRLLSSSMETETRLASKKKADTDAINIFAMNLKQLLLAPPLGEKRIMAIDPGFRTGCKVVCLSAQGDLLNNVTIFPHSGENSRKEAGVKITSLCKSFNIEAIAIGNGTASRETEAFIRELNLPQHILTIIVDESGASVYSASDTAREEFPDFDVTVRGSISIGRRLSDPLAELVKIDPKSIGVGQYQHDVDQKALRQSLDDVVISCVNAVGVEVNTASVQLLNYVSGLGPQLAKNIVLYREKNGPFPSREDLKKVPRLGAKAFEQAAGFLRIRESDNPLDASAVHPESYHVVKTMAGDLGCEVIDLIRDQGLRSSIVPERYLSDTVGILTVNDIIQELAKPGRDPRETFEQISFSDGVTELKDIRLGMTLTGVVTNLTAFGAFVDIGVHCDGLVHVSQITDRFIKNPAEVLKIRQKVSVTVLEVDYERKRISLSMINKDKSKDNKNKSDKVKPAVSKNKPENTPKKTTPSPFNNAFAKAMERKK